MTTDCSDLPPAVLRLGVCCCCGDAVRSDAFRDATSEREYAISALCQICQDAMFLGGNDADPPVSEPVRAGAVLAAAFSGGAPCDGRRRGDRRNGGAAISRSSVGFWLSAQGDSGGLRQFSGDAVRVLHCVGAGCGA